jgi:hypothetical protein
MAFNENSRVKIPAILHLRRLGYTYLPLGKVGSLGCGDQHLHGHLPGERGALEPGT